MNEKEIIKTAKHLDIDVIYDSHELPYIHTDALPELFAYINNKRPIHRKDKNGTQIYEGDVLKLTAPMDEFVSTPVQYYDRMFVAWEFDTDDLLENGRDALDFQDKCIEVIGNKYENK